MKPAIVALLLLAAASSPAPSSGSKKGPLVLAVSGGVALESAPASAVLPRSWLAKGDALRLADGARLVLVFRSGRRFEAQGAGLVRIDGDTLQGPGVRELPALPAWPVRLQPEEVQATRPGGLRVRAGRIEGLRPADGAALLADDAWLSFTPEASATSYAIEVRDERGRLVFEARTATAPLRVPSGRLLAGKAYCWTVETVDAIGPGAQGEAAFRTLSLEELRAYESTRDRLRAVPEPEAQAYLAAIDVSLGLPERR